MCYKQSMTLCATLSCCISDPKDILNKIFFLYVCSIKPNCLINLRINVNICTNFSVSSNVAGNTNFRWGACLPMSDGAVCMFLYSLYRLQCSTSTCNWSKMSQTMDHPVHYATTVEPLYSGHAL